MAVSTRIKPSEVRQAQRLSRNLGTWDSLFHDDLGDPFAELEPLPEGAKISPPEEDGEHDD